MCVYIYDVCVGTPPLDICVRQHAILESNAFRLTRLYLHSVDATLKKHKSLLVSVFRKFTPRR